MHCLSKGELEQLIDLLNSSSPVDDEYLSILIDDAKNWQEELGMLTYFVSQIIENKKASCDCIQLIDLIYKIEEQIFVKLQECDSEYIDYMLKNVCDSHLSLEEELVDIQNRLSEYNYERTLRY
jgi:hypothetical protein